MRLYIYLTDLSQLESVDLNRDLLDDGLRFRHRGRPYTVSLPAGLRA